MNENLSQSVFDRATEDAGKIIKSVYFIFLDAFLALCIGMFSGSPVVGFFAFLVAFLVIFTWCLFWAPINQRDDARALALKLSEPEPARTLTEKQRLKIKDVLVTSGIKPSDLNVLYDNLDAECADFAADLGAAIEAAGITTSIHDGIMHPKKVTDRGIQIIRGKGKVTIKLADMLFDCLSEMGFAVERCDASQPGELYFFIARQPKG